MSNNAIIATSITIALAPPTICHAQYCHPHISCHTHNMLKLPHAQYTRDPTVHKHIPFAYIISCMDINIHQVTELL